jgi:O-antigen/teichoic acid export membrane protein
LAASADPSSLVRNTSSLLAARGAALAANAIVTVVAVRTLSTTEYGRFAFAIALVTLAVSVSELGISALATRQMVEDRPDTGRILGAALGAEVATSAVAAVVLVLAAVLIQHDSRTMIVVAVACGVVLLQGALAALDTPFQAARTMGPVARYSLIQSVVLLTFGVGLVLAGTGAIGLISASLLANGCAALAAARGVRRLGVAPTRPRAIRDVTSFVRGAAVIALTGTFATIYERVDVLLVAHYEGSTSVAFYSAPLTILVVLYAIPAAVTTSYFPLLSAGLRESREHARASFELVLRVFLIAGPAMACVLGFAAGDLVTLAFGERYAPSAVVLELMSPILALSFVNYICWQALLAAHREHGKALIMAVALAINIALNVILIPKHGIRGAAYALLVTEVLIVLGQAVIVHRQVFRLDLVRLLFRPVVAVVAATAAAVTFAGVEMVVRGIIIASVYVAALAALQYVTPTEWRPLTAPLRALASRSRD